MTTHVVDLYHGDKPVAFSKLHAAGVVGVILKSTQGAHIVDPAYEANYAEAVAVFGRTRVHAYHFLTGEDPAAQVRHFLTVTAGRPGRWLDYENPACSIGTAVDACHLLHDKQGSWPGMYGSDGDLLGQALDAGHFTVCPLWIARYSTHPPKHPCQLWQFQAGESGGEIAGYKLDVNTYVGPGDCDAWLDSLCH